MMNGHPACEVCGTPIHPRQYQDPATCRCCGPHCASVLARREHPRSVPAAELRIISATCPECGERQALVIARDTPPTCILCDAPLEDRRG